MRDRVDKVLVSLGLVRSRSQAKLLIEEGVVFYENKQVKKTGQLVTKNNLVIKKDIQYVGRGAHKLEGALKKFNIEPSNMVIADIGASTGGFTDLLLKKNVRKVYAIDVGHDQLVPELKEHEKVINMEGVNIKYPLALPEKVDLCVVDLSFISLRLTLKNIFNLLKKKGEVITLVKPQFEAGKSALKRGIVVGQETRIETLKLLYDFCKQNNFIVKNMMVSPVKGKNGNVEYFFCLSDIGEFCEKELIDTIEEES